MKIKTTDLSGRPLTWAVCKALGYVPAKKIKQDGGVAIVEAPELEFSTMVMLPGAGGAIYFSTFDFEGWAQAGPIIEQEKIGFGHSYEHPAWIASGHGIDDPVFYGPTPVISAMRCYVASELGDVLDIPDILLPGTS